MLISLLAILATAVLAGARLESAAVPYALEGPTTLELALIGAGVLTAYALVSRSIGRRSARISNADAANQLAITSPRPATLNDGNEQEPSRGAA